MSVRSLLTAVAVLMGTLFAVACDRSQGTSPTVPSILSSSTVDARSSGTAPALEAALNGTRTLVVDNDGADCANADYGTIQAAVDAAEVGTTILVCAGTYNERVVIEKNGLRLLARGAPDTVVLDGDSPFPPAANHAFHLVNVSDVLVEGFTVREYFENIRMSGGGGNTVRKNRTTAAGHDGIFAFNSADNVIEHNVSFDNPSGNACGVNIAGPGSVGNLVRHNVLINNNWGINFQGGATNNVAFNNESRGNRSHGIINRGAATTGSTIENNTVENNPTGIEVQVSSGVTVARNHAFHNTTFDLVDAGVNNAFENNHCETSLPMGLCEHSEGASK